MKTYNELERAKRDKIRQLSVEEAERYINKLNKDMADAWGSLDNGFNIDIDTMLRNAELCDEAEDILNDKYKMDLMIATSRSNALAEKHIADMEDVRKMILKTSLTNLMSVYWQTSHNMLILTQFLNLLYQHYWISPADMEELIDMGNANEDSKTAVIYELDIDKIPVYAMYRQHFMNSLELDIKHMASIIDNEMIILKRLIQFQFKEDDNDAASTDSDYAIFKEGMIEYQKLSYELIADYEELKKDGFKNAKTIEAEIMADSLDMDVDYFNDMFKNNRPSYDVNNFIFIPPVSHQESMAKYHPDWKGSYAADDNVDDMGMNKWYAEVTNQMP